VREKQKTPLREHALRLLSRREHSRAELARKLRGFESGVDPAEVETLLDELAARKLLSDERYAEGRAHVLSKKYGASRVAHELRSKGVSAELVEETSRAARETDLARARDIWRRKFRSPGTSREERAKQMRFLQARGFSFDVIRAVMNTDDDAEPGGDDAV
jgi:regulatory protein